MPPGDRFLQIAGRSRNGSGDGDFLVAGFSCAELVSVFRHLSAVCNELSMKQKYKITLLEKMQLFKEYEIFSKTGKYVI